MDPRKEKVIQALLETARPHLREEFERASCIASTRIGIDVLEYFGIKAEPVSLFLIILNDEAMKMLTEEEKTMQDVKEATEKRGLGEPGGPWTMGIGADVENGDGWAGHLMIGLPEDQVLLDLSIDQASRPHKNLVLEQPAAFGVTDEKWWRGEERYTVMKGEDDEGHETMLILDREAPDPDGYRRSRNWRRTSSKHGGRRVFQEVTGKIIRAMKEELDGLA